MQIIVELKHAAIENAHQMDELDEAAAQLHSELEMVLAAQGESSSKIGIYSEQHAGMKVSDLAS